MGRIIQGALAIAAMLFLVLALILTVVMVGTWIADASKSSGTVPAKSANPARAAPAGFQPVTPARRTVQRSPDQDVAARFASIQDDEGSA